MDGVELLHLLLDLADGGLHGFHVDLVHLLGPALLEDEGASDADGCMEVDVGAGIFFIPDDQDIVSDPAKRFPVPCAPAGEDEDTDVGSSIPLGLLEFDDCLPVGVPGAGLGFDHDASTRVSVLGPHGHHEVALLAVLDPADDGADRLEHIAGALGLAPDQTCESDLEVVAVLGRGLVRAFAALKPGEGVADFGLEVGLAFDEPLDVPVDLALQAGERRVLSVQRKLVQEHVLGDVHPLDETRQRGVLVIEGELRGDLAEVIAKFLAQSAVAVGELSEQAGERRLLVVEREFGEHAGLLVSHSGLDEVTDAFVDGRGLGRVQQPHHRAIYADLRCQNTRQLAVGAGEDIAKDCDELTVVRDQALEPRRQGTGLGIEVLPQTVTKEHRGGLGVLHHCLAHVADNALALMADSLGIDFPARLSQREDPDAERRQGDIVSLVKVADWREVFDDLGVPDQHHEFHLAGHTVVAGAIETGGERGHGWSPAPRLQLVRDDQDVTGDWVASPPRHVTRAGEAPVPPDLASYS